MDRRRFRIICLLGGLGLAAAGGPGAQAADSLVLYSGQHEQSVDMLVTDFTKRSGIEVKVRHGEGPEIASQIVKEGTSSPADVYFTENAPELTQLQEKGLLAPVDPATLAQVPAKYNSANGSWVGVLARETALVYHTAAVTPADLPASILDLAAPSWKGRVAIAPGDPDFPPLVSAVIALKGRDAALRWLRGLEANAQTFDDFEGVVAAVNHGDVAVGIINNYYWLRLAHELGAGATHSALYHFARQDPGGAVNVSGAAVLKSSRHGEQAQKFLAYLVSAEAQTLLAQTDITFEYPVRPGIAANKALTPFDQLQPPALDWQALGDDKAAVALLREAGLL